MKELTVKEAAAMLGLSDPRIKQLIVEGKLKARHLNPRMMMIEESSVKRELKRRSVKDQQRKAR